MSAQLACAAHKNATEVVGATCGGESRSRWSGSQNEVRTPSKEQNMPSMTATPDIAPAHRFEVPLSGGLEAGFRTDPEAPMVAAVRTASNGEAIVELEIDAATSGFDNAAWLTTTEAVEYALAILHAAGAAAAQNLAAR